MCLQHDDLSYLSQTHMEPATVPGAAGIFTSRRRGRTRGREQLRQGRRQLSQRRQGPVGVSDQGRQSRWEQMEKAKA